MFAVIRFRVCAVIRCRVCAVIRCRGVCCDKV